MRIRSILLWSLILPLAFSLAPLAVFNHPFQPHTLSLKQHSSQEFATVDPDYIYNQLFFMATHFQHREAGYDTIATNGHKQFATYWSQEMMRNLQGLGAQVRQDTFSIHGWVGRPTTSSAYNVEVSVPGASHPEQVVVIGCHYDGEALSTQSANDDASGCAIELGVAQALGTYWRQHHTYPSRTLRFVIFDAEESGLYGSFHYLDHTIHGDITHLVAMFNEEQSGIAYPLRYLGQLKNPLLPFHIDMSPLGDSQLYPDQSQLSQAQKDHITQFRQLMKQAVPAVFQQFQTMGYQGLTYHTENHQDIAEPVFTSNHLQYIHQEDDTLGSSDQVPFTLSGIPCATFAGNTSYYQNNAPPWSYPYDQSQDTIQLMNTFADGSSQKANALALALALPGMLTTWMLQQPALLGETPLNTIQPGTPITAISDIENTLVGQPIALDAKASLDPRQENNSLTYTWDFGDGTKASGITAQHTYTAAGTYTLTLTTSTPTGQFQIKKAITVTTSSPSLPNLYAKYPADGQPPSNPQVVLPTPNDALSDKVMHTPIQDTTPSTNTNSTGSSSSVPIAILLLLFALVLFTGVGILFGLRKGRQENSSQP